MGRKKTNGGGARAWFARSESPSEGAASQSPGQASPTGLSEASQDAASEPPGSAKRYISDLTHLMINIIILCEGGRR